MDFFAIVIDLPAQDAAGKAILDPATKLAIYQVNYFCGLDKTTIPGVVLNEWDTDKNFAKRFGNETAAENFRRVILESLDGTRVVEMKPDLKNNRRIS